MNTSRDAQRKVKILQGLRAWSSPENVTKKVLFPAKHLPTPFRLYECSRYSGCSGMDRDLERKPRGGSRGVNDTQLFRLLTRKKRCLAREATLLPPVCQLFLPSNTLPVDSNVERKMTHMKKQSLLANLVLAGALAVAVPVFAKPMSTTLPITHDVKVGQTELKAGDYRFLIDGNHLTVLNGKKMVAEADGRWEDRDSKAQFNSVVSNAEGKVIELRFEGKKTVFVLPQ